MTAPADPSDDIEPLALEALLRWYVAMGVDAPVVETPRDCFVMAEPVRATPADAASAIVAPPPASRVQTVTGGSSPDALIAEAHALAASAKTLEELRDRWASLPGCGLAVTASRMIFTGGTPGTRLMLVGGAPDSDDERQGEAFCGPKGRLLDAMLHAIGLDRGRVSLGHVIPWRPPGNRAPTPLELGLCLPFARRHIALVAPELLLCLGERAAQPLLVSREPISRLRGRWLSVEGDRATVKTLVTFSLDFLLTQPLQKRRAWSDLQMVAAALDR